MKLYGGVEIERHILFTSVLDWTERLASQLRRFTPGGKSSRRASWMGN